MRMSTQMRVRKSAALLLIAVVSTFITAAVLHRVIIILHNDHVVGGQIAFTTAWTISGIVFVASVIVKMVTDRISEVLL